MQNQHGFIIALIRKGKEVNDAAETFETGTYVEIIDWNTLNNNLLGITIQGRQRVIINKTHIHDDNLISAEFTYLKNRNLIQLTKICLVCYITYKNIPSLLTNTQT